MWKIRKYHFRVAKSNCRPTFAIHLKGKGQLLLKAERCCVADLLRQNTWLWVWTWMCGQSDYLWWGFSNVADQIAELSTTVRPRQFRHNGLLVLGDENRPLASDQMLSDVAGGRLGCSPCTQCTAHSISHPKVKINCEILKTINPSLSCFLGQYNYRLSLSLGYALSA